MQNYFTSRRTQLIVVFLAYLFARLVVVEVVVTIEVKILTLPGLAET